MHITAFTKSVSISPRKVRLVAHTIRNKKAKDALAILMLLRKRGSASLIKVLESAMANATHNAKLSLDGLMIKAVEVTDGPALKRFHPSTRGRVHPYKKRTSHIRITLEGGNA